MAGMGTKVRVDRSEVYTESQVKSDVPLDHSESQSERDKWTLSRHIKN